MSLTILYINNNPVTWRWNRASPAAIFASALDYDDDDDNNIYFTTIIYHNTRIYTQTRIHTYIHAEHIL